ncbi:Crp/Fnr family transcriptional regulator [Hymenobacter crusticola]|uniref:Cyclic nucleotide-binding protein n=1 Tax=Hymenobacter crusticola TaxID=1770526 RepID=A0A243WG15_9BACT|nr:Crp/Fnr family transcriptional regulator [Hymenobacter crusticola]OUJ74107.1 cyclic nucleotide-binding protein [Hymenobacter crusticola]
MYAPLLAHIARYVTLAPAEIDLLLSYLRHQAIARKDFLLTAGQVCPANYFVLKGCVRTYFLTEAGKEHTTYFSIENWWVADYASLSAHSPSDFYLQAVEDVEVAALDPQAQEEVLRRLPQLERYFRIIFQRAMTAAQFRFKFLFGLSGEARYQAFTKAQPEFVQRVPQYMLASYLGFTPEFLSKIRAKMGHE